MKKFYLYFLSLSFLMCANAQLVIFGDDYGTGVAFAPFGGSSNSLTVDDTESRPGSAGSKSLRIAVPGGGYTGGAMVASEPRNASAFNAISFWVKASKAATLNVTGLGNNSAATTFFETEYNNIPITTEWKRVIMPVPDASKLTAFNGLWHFAEGADEGVYNIWIDDLQYENIATVGAPTAASIATQNLTIGVGATFAPTGIAATIPVDGTPITFAQVGRAFLTLTSNPAGRITFDATGLATAAESGAATVTATLGGTAVTGTINVTVSGSGSALPSEAAPNPPGRAPGDVVSVFSDFFTSAATMSIDATFSPPANTVRTVPVEGNNVLELTTTGGTFTGFRLSNSIDLTNMTFLHYDLWIAGTPQPGAVFNTTVSQHGGGYLTGETQGYVHTNIINVGQEGKWVSFDIPFSTFAPSLATGAKDFISQLVFTHVNSTNTGPIFMDNIYFYREGPLPVKWAAFTATEKANTVVLNWSTSTEINNRGFAVERSNDGRGWNELTFVNATAANGAGASYTSVDFAPLQGINYYRLRQMDYDGKFSYSQVRQVNFNGTVNAVSLYPNPANQQLQIVSGKFTDKGSYTIVDMQGKQVQSGVFPQLQAPMQIGLNKLAPGMYSIILRDANKTETVRFVVQ